MSRITGVTSLFTGPRLVLKTAIHTILINGSAAKEPCIANGGSPFWFTGYPRVTGEILTGPHSHPYRYCGMTSKKSMSDMGNVRHRVDYPSTQNSSKEDAALPFLPHSADSTHPSPASLFTSFFLSQEAHCHA